MDDKKLKILQMVENKIITVEEAMNLLALLENKEEKKKADLSKEERKQQKELVRKIKYEVKARKEEAEKSSKSADEEVHAVEIVKLSEGEFEILPREQKTGTKLQKKGWFSGKLFGGGRKLVIRVEEKGKPVVNLRLPLGFITPFIKGGLKIGQMNSPEFRQYMNQIDPEELNQYLDSGYVGPLIDVYDEKDGEHVYIGIE